MSDHANAGDRTRVRRAAFAGIIGPVTFLVIGSVMAAVRFEVIRAQSWSSWPSSMAVGGWIGLPQIFAFLFLTACYLVFAPQAVRPTIANPAAWIGFLIIAIGDVFLAFPTDGPNHDTSWHGFLHATGVIVATIGTLVAVIGVTIGTRGDTHWRAWRWVGAPVALAGIVVGVIGGLELGWAKLVYVIGITLPVPLIAVLIRTSVVPVNHAAAEDAKMQP